MSLNERKQEQRYQTLANKLQAAYFDSMERLSAVADISKQVLETTTTVM
jgi:hypothetical protein